PNPDVDLVDTLNGDEFTVIAPVDDAFDAVPKDDLDVLTEDSDELTKVLTYHVIPGQLSPEEVSGEHETVEGSKVDVSGEGEDMKFDDAELVCGGVKTANATVYMVDSVMMPEKCPPHRHRGQGPIDEMPLGPWPRFSAPPVIRRGSPADRMT